jgi:UDP-N-acetylglucosamine diphosphorylase / glucose-1-phosphate thymidylyltransferase / UDP-N-acetylgalactosamine diphosphorylase / glucosamine-1-phosphate N-acetyltransferase / galactosamine-1-phosphate N-acetyltransferase
MLSPRDFFDLNDLQVAELFAGCEYAWQVLERLADYIARQTQGKQTIQGQVMAGAYLSDRPVFIGTGARIDPGAYVHGPAYIGPNAVVRHGAFIRENVVLLSGAILGHASEAKNSLFLPGAHAPHFNYIGDSVLGQRSNLGAGSKLSNLPLVSEKDPMTGRRPTIKIMIGGQEFDTGLAKLGAILGDDVQTGCNVVLNPGCLIGRNSLVYANLSLRKGYYPANTVIKLRQTSELVDRR